MTGALICSDCGTALKPNPHRKGTRCKPCNARMMARSLDKRAKCRVAMNAHFANPVYHAEHVARCTAGIRAAMLRPDFAAARREAGRRVGATKLGHSRHPAGTPERIAAGRKRSETLLAWCPIEYRDEYRRLVRTKLIRAPEARRMVEDMIAADMGRYMASGRLPQAARSRAVTAR